MPILTIFHRLLHPHLARHLHLRALDVTVGTWQLLLWAAIVPLAWALYRFVYQRRDGSAGLGWILLASVVGFQAAAFVTFAVWRNGDVLFVLLWCSLASLLGAAALLPPLRFGPGRRPGAASS